MRLCRALLLSNNILLKASYCLLSTFYLLQTTIYQLPTFLTVKCWHINKLNSVLLTKLVSKYEDVYFSKEYSVDFSINHTINYTGGEFYPPVFSSIPQRSHCAKEFELAFIGENLCSKNFRPFFSIYSFTWRFLEFG